MHVALAECDAEEKLVFNVSHNVEVELDDFRLTDVRLLRLEFPRSKEHLSRAGIGLTFKIAAYFLSSRNFCADTLVVTKHCND